MTNTAPAAKTAEAATPCECSFYEAVDGAELTDENLASGNYTDHTTECSATTRNTFAPGHDAKLKSHLIKWAVQGLDISRNEGGMRVSADAQHWADKHGFGHMVASGIAKATEKAEARATRQAKAAERKANKPKKAERKLAEKAGIVTHDGNSARQEREAKALTLAEIGQAEDAAYREAEAKKVAEREASADWDEPKTDDAAEVGVDLTGLDEVIAKIGRWEYKGIEKDGTFYYLAKDGHTRKETTKYQVVRAV